MVSKPSEDALLVLAHGAPVGDFNARVARMMDRVQWDGPKGIAFMMPLVPEEELAEVAARLDRGGVRRIILVPLLISSFSEHYEEVRYFAGLRPDRPAVLEHADDPPLSTTARLVVTKAMDSHPLLTRILEDQARATSKDPQSESLVLVAHGPTEDPDNEIWLDHLRIHAKHLQQAIGFRRVEVATLRHDAPQAVKDIAVAKMRAIVSAAGADSRVIIQPVLISLSHVQQEIAESLLGLPFEMSKSGVSGHPLTLEWIREQALSAN
jgi:sirohydrochlorin ferrochelatase